MRERVHAVLGVTTPIVPMLAALAASAVQISRRNTETEVLPLVPVTAATVFGCAPKNAAAMRASRARGFVVGDEAHAERFRVASHLRLAEHGRGAALHGVADELSAVRARAGQGGKQIAGLYLAAVAREPGNSLHHVHGT